MKKKSIIISALSFLILILSSSTSKAQTDCCAGFNFNNFSTYCIENLNPCNTGTTCSGAVLDAAFGITGDWLNVTCSGSGGDCTASGCNFIILPVELVKFSLNYKDNSIELNWVTASETKNEGFEIERSSDGLNWTYLDFVAGKGDTDELQDYRYIDENPKLGFNYYRLKQIDFDGAYEYSSIKVGIWQGSTDRDQLKMAVLPNPATTWITAALPVSITKAENIEFRIYDQIGRLVKTTIIDPDSEIRIELEGLADGFYILNASQKNFQYSTTFVKK